jgi:hypothetical protein
MEINYKIRNIIMFDRLYFAVKNSNLEMVKILLKAGDNPDACKNNNALFTAVESSNLEMVKILLKAGANPDGNMFLNPLFMAAERSNLEMVKMLLEAGANPDGYHHVYLSSNPLCQAVKNSNLEIVEMLLEAGANPNGFHRHFNPFYIIAKAKDLTALKIFEKYIDKFDFSDPWNLLFNDIRNNDFTQIKFILDNALEDKDYLSSVFLCYASLANRNAIIDSLLKYGASIFNIGFVKSYKLFTKGEQDKIFESLGGRIDKQDLKLFQYIEKNLSDFYTLNEALDLFTDFNPEKFKEKFDEKLISSIKSSDLEDSSLEAASSSSAASAELASPIASFILNPEFLKQILIYFVKRGVDPAKTLGFHTFREILILINDSLDEEFAKILLDNIIEHRCIYTLEHLINFNHEKFDLSACDSEGNNFMMKATSNESMMIGILSIVLQNSKENEMLIKALNTKNKNGETALDILKKINPGIYEMYDCHVFIVHQEHSSSADGEALGRSLDTSDNAAAASPTSDDAVLLLGDE